MMTVDTRTEWLAAFVREPSTVYPRLIAGYSNPHPYERADPPDVARAMFGQLDENDPARAALDLAVLAWLESWPHTCAPAQPAPYQNWVRQLCETLEITYILKLPQTSEALHREQEMWERVCKQHVIAPCRDPLSTLHRTLRQAIIDAKTN